jgi:ABC-2 type transport system ATP-binding protein
MHGVRDGRSITDARGLVDLTDRTGAVAGTLSGGQRRRLSLACALVHRPAVLFLDEPTVGIDPQLRVQFWAHFQALARAGITIVVSSHVMDEADRCDELLFVRSGRVIARGSGADLLAGAAASTMEQAFLTHAGQTAVTR